MRIQGYNHLYGNFRKAPITSKLRLFPPLTIPFAQPAPPSITPLSPVTPGKKSTLPKKTIAITCLALGVLVVSCLAANRRQNSALDDPLVTNRESTEQAYSMIYGDGSSANHPKEGQFQGYVPEGFGRRKSEHPDAMPYVTPEAELNGINGSYSTDSDEEAESREAKRSKWRLSIGQQSLSKFIINRKPSEDIETAVTSLDGVFQKVGDTDADHPHEDEEHTLVHIYGQKNEFEDTENSSYYGVPPQLLKDGRVITQTSTGK